MAGDWIKMEVNLPMKPEVLAMSASTGLHPDAIVGKCFRLWTWFDQHTQDGNASGVTTVTLGYALGNGDDTTNFINAMVGVGWLEETSSGVSLPNFDRHNGKTSKERALTAKRVAKSRNKSNGECNVNGVTDVTVPPLAREEKRREDKNTYDARGHLVSMGVEKSIAEDWLKTRKVKKLAATETAIKGVVAEAQKTGKPLAEVIKLCCEQGWGGFKASWLEQSGITIGGQAKSLQEMCV